jgi:hypothetical protein
MAPVDTAHEDDLGDYYLAGTSERHGTFFVNIQPPRPAHELAATSFHEANPGHHLQTALELEVPDRHVLRRNASELQGAAYVEDGGWTASARPTRWGCTQTTTNAWACSTCRHCGPRGWSPTPASTPWMDP